MKYGNSSGRGRGELVSRGLRNQRMGAVVFRRPLFAFTLIELMAVILIISLMIGVSMPVFMRTYRGELLRSEASLLRATVQHARYQAIVQQQPMLLNLDFTQDQQKYWICASPAVQTNLMLQVLNLSTNALSVGTGTVSPPDDPTTNAVVIALPQITLHELHSPVSLSRFQALDNTITASETTTITFYPNGASQGGLIVLGGADNDSLGIEIDPLTSLSRLIANVQP